MRRLLDRGNHVISLDNYFTGTRENLSRFPHPLSTRPCPADHENQRPGRTEHPGLANQCGAKVLQASASEVYGDPEISPQSEEYLGRVNPIGPRVCYDAGKRCAETLFFDYYRQYGLRIKVARIFNTYGPRMQPEDGRVVSTFITQALAGRPITIFGEGLQTRSFCFVDELVDGLILLMDSGDEVTGPINLGRPVFRGAGDSHWASGERAAEAQIPGGRAGGRAEVLASSGPRGSPPRRPFRRDFSFAQLQ